MMHSLKPEQVESDNWQQLIMPWMFILWNQTMIWLVMLILCMILTPASTLSRPILQISNQTQIATAVLMIPSLTLLMLPPTYDLPNFDNAMEHCVYVANQHHILLHPTTIEVKPMMTMPNDPDYESLNPNFGWLPFDVIKSTFQHTTQYAQMPMSAVLQKCYHSPYLALNVHCHLLSNHSYMSKEN